MIGTEKKQLYVLVIKIIIFRWLTSESGPLSAPGHVKETNSWHRLCTTKLHTVKIKYQISTNNIFHK